MMLNSSAGTVRLVATQRTLSLSSKNRHGLVTVSELRAVDLEATSVKFVPAAVWDGSIDLYGVEFTNVEMKGL